MGVWEGRLVMFESLVNQQIHPLSFSLSLLLSPCFLPPTPSRLPSPPSLLLNNMGSVSGHEKKKNTASAQEGESQTKLNSAKRSSVGYFVRVRVWRVLLHNWDVDAKKKNENKYIMKIPSRPRYNL